ncbi:helix-turn-helix transcriptional regulator, partial [Pseudomonadota bacterium]
MQSPRKKSSLKEYNSTQRGAIQASTNYEGSLDKFDRIYALHKILSHARHPVSRHKMERELECSRATFGRIVDAMRDYLGAPIVYCSERNGWYYDTKQNTNYELPGLWFNAHELNALLAINKLMQDLQPGLLGEQLKPVQHRIEKLLANQQLGSGELPQRVRIIAIGMREGGKAFQTVAEAVLQRKQLNIHYHARTNDQA